MNRIADSPPEWRPELATPDVAIYTSWHLGLEQDFGENLARWLLEHAKAITFPATDPSTRVPDNERPTTTYRMRYAGPNIFTAPDASPEVLVLDALYRELPDKWQRRFGIAAKPLGPNGREAEAFITNPFRHEGADPHNDTYLTAAGYPLPGAGLIVSHCVNARHMEDIREQPSTLVLPPANSIVLFQGTLHPHVGINPGILSTDDPSTRREKFDAARRRFNVATTVHAFFDRDRFGPCSDDRGPSAFPYLLQAQPGSEDRVVLSLNFGVDAAMTSSLDTILK